MVGMRQALVLGTAQWGRDYGITNPRHRLSDQDVLDILETAQLGGIKKLDTAAGYQDALQRAALLAPTFELQTKISTHRKPVIEIRSELANTLMHLSSNQPLSCLIHDWSKLGSQERSRSLAEMVRLRESGQLEGIGISVYVREDLEHSLDELSQLDVIQLPVSLLDQRFVDSPIVSDLRNAGVKIQVRSIFLQGLLLSQPLTGGSHPDVLKFWQRVGVSRHSRLKFCVAFIQSQEWIDEVVIGVTSQSELAEIHDALTSSKMTENWKSFASTDITLVDPRKW